VNASELGVRGIGRKKIFEISLVSPAEIGLNRTSLGSDRHFVFVIILPAASGYHSSPFIRIHGSAGCSAQLRASEIQ
jgi:hypothetical protein